MKKILFALIFTVCSAGSHAALISSNGFTLDESTDIITGGGFEWLQWDVTVGRTVQEFVNGDVDLSAFGGGWSLANGGQIADLLNAFFPTAQYDSSDSFQFNSEDFDGVDSADETLINNSDKAFVRIFGDTSQTFNVPFVLNDVFEGSFAFFSDDPSAIFNSREVNVNDDYISDGFGNVSGIPGTSLITGSSIGNAQSFRGLALIREISTTTAPVPSPSSVLLMVLAFAGFIFQRRGRVEK